MSTPSWLINLGLETVPPDQSSIRPDLCVHFRHLPPVDTNLVFGGFFFFKKISRQIAEFFTGILFAASLYYFFHSPTLPSIFSRLLRRRVGPPQTARNHAQRTVESQTASNRSTSISHRSDPLALVFILDLVYITTAATQFGTLLSYSSATGAVPCTFLVAWATLGEFTSQSLSFPVLLIVIIIYFRSKVPKPSVSSASSNSPFICENVALPRQRNTFSGFYCPFPLLSCSSSPQSPLVFSSQFLIGIRSPFVTSDSAFHPFNSFFRYPSFHPLIPCTSFVAGGALSRGLNLLIELFVLARFFGLFCPRIPAVNPKQDIQIYRTLSLIALDAVTFYPSLLPTSLLADFLPFALVSILVLIAFNHTALFRQSLVSSILNGNEPSLPQSIRAPTPNLDPPPTADSPTSSKERSIIELDLERERGRSIRLFDVAKGYPHPFAAASITRSQQPQRRWISPYRATGSAVHYSSSLTDSVRDAVVATANRTRIYPAEEPIFLTTGDLGTALTGDNPPAIQGPKAGRGDSSRRRSFLPALRTTVSGPEQPSDDTRMGRQILVGQVEVADRMMATSRPVRPEHRPLGSLSSAHSQDHASYSSPPAPPRPQRVLLQDPHPMLILGEDTIHQAETRPSTSDSAIVFGSDILIRSQDDVMRMRNEPVEGGSLGTREASIGHGSAREDGSLGDRLYRNSGLSLRIASPSRRSFGASMGEGSGSPAGESSGPHAGASNARMDVDVLSVVHEGESSPEHTGNGAHPPRTSRRAQKRPTFGESLFDRFQRNFPFSEGASSGSVADPLSPFGATTTTTRQDAQGNQSRSSRHVHGPRTRTSTSTPGGGGGGGRGSSKRQGSSPKRPST